MADYSTTCSYENDFGSFRPLHQERLTKGGVLKALQNTLGMASPLAIATAVFAALQTAKIIATPVPTFAKGGFVGGALKYVGGAVKSCLLPEALSILQLECQALDSSMTTAASRG